MTISANANTLLGFLQGEKGKKYMSTVADHIALGLSLPNLVSAEAELIESGVLELTKKGGVTFFHLNSEESDQEPIAA